MAAKAMAAKNMAANAAASGGNRRLCLAIARAACRGGEAARLAAANVAQV